NPTMRFLIAPEFAHQMQQRDDHTPDCYVRPGEYLHHLYIEGVKYVVAPAVAECLQEAEARGDIEAVRHLRLHQEQYDALLAQVQEYGSLEGVNLLGDPPPEDDGDGVIRMGQGYVPLQPKSLQETGLSLPFLFEMVLRAIYNRGRLTGG